MPNLRTSFLEGFLIKAIYALFFLLKRPHISEFLYQWIMRLLLVYKSKEDPSWPPQE